MDNPTLMRILRQAPEARLKLLELAEQRTDLTPNPTREQQRKLAEATTQALNYINATRRLGQSMQRMAMPPSG